MMITEVSYSKPGYRKKLLALQRCCMRWVEASTAACPHVWTLSIFVPQLS